VFVARILYPVEVLGPGMRVGIWLSGCERRCEGCISPDLWVQREEQNISVGSVATLIEQIARENRIDGFTISGGEPFLQASELNDLLSVLKIVSDDVLVYTGFTLEELNGMTDENVAKALAQIAVLIDGVYIQSLNDGAILRGSRNQRMHILRKDLTRAYQEYCSKERNELQNFADGDAVVTVGIRPALEAI